LWAQYQGDPTITNQDIRDHLILTAEDLGASGRDRNFGYGMVRADLAVNTPINSPGPSIPTITTSGTTNITPTTIDGTGDIGSTIELFNGVTSLGTQTADGSGNWQFTNVVLAEGDNSFTATAFDGVNTSDLSAATVITLDTVAPSIPTITTAGTTNITPTTIVGTADGDSIIELFHDASSLGTQTADGSGNWQFTNVVLAEGDNSFTATASDGVNTSDLSAATVITLDTINSPSLLAHYQFEDNLLDSTGNGNTGTINIDGSETYVVGLDGKAFDFDGSTLVELTDNSFNSQSQGTVAAWINPSSVHTGIIFGAADSANANGLWALYAKVVDGEIKLSVFTRTPLTRVVADTSIPTNAWTHVALSGSGDTADPWKLYVNGVEQSVTVQIGTNEARWWDTQQTNDLRYDIGAWERSTGTIAFFNGAIDDLRVYDFELTEEQITDLFLLP
jgi:hypothetical protein